jgi:hypothetical protein
MYDVEPLLAYMVGAGVGKIDVRAVNGSTNAGDPMIVRMRDLNREVSVRVVTELLSDPTLTLVVAGSAAVLAEIRAVCAERPRRPMVFTRLDMPARVAVLPAPPPCPICADADLFALFTRRAENAGFVAMVAAVETFKVLARCAPVPTPVLIEFKGYESAVHALSAASQVGCECSRILG